MLLGLGHHVVEIRKPCDLENIQGLILPGGESTTMSKLLLDFHLLEPIKEKIIKGLPVLGTCAGLILLAKEVENDPITTLGVMNITVKRNAYGRQLDSFVVEQIIPEISNLPLPLVFIRAPYIDGVASTVEILCTINDQIVAVREGNILGMSFHPELTTNTSIHDYFISIIRAHTDLINSLE